MNVIGVDVGGTFTDIVLVTEDSKRFQVHKVPTTSEAQEEGVVKGVREILAANNLDGECIDLIVHGTTIATNAMLQRRGAKVALLTTEGLEDIIEIGRQNREEIYSLIATRPEPLVDRENRIGVQERIAADGSQIVPLTGTELDRITTKLNSLDVDSVAIALLFSFKNPIHEKLLLERIRSQERFYVVASSEVLPEFREFERISTTVLEAYLGPLVLGYLSRLEEKIRDVCPKAKLTVIQSNGGTRLCSKTQGQTITLALSGLAGGVLGAWEIAQAENVSQVISLDMGGTSCDVSAINGGVVVRPENTVAGLPIRIPSVDVKTIGAGGGSIAWIDDEGILHVGPQSAGANPGPAAYNLGGHHATVTDANLVVGRLNPYYFLGGRVELSLKNARRAIGQLAKQLSLSTEETALGIIRISSTNMMQAIREVTVERGLDPRKYVLIPFGGAGPTQAVDIAESLGIRRIVVPPFPGITSALGLLYADFRVDLMKTVLLRKNESRTDTSLLKTFENLEREAEKRLIDQGASAESIRFDWRIDIRYAGQSHEITVDLPYRTSNLLTVSRSLFEKRHEEMYGYRLPDREVEWVTVRVVAWSHSKALSKYTHFSLEQGEPYEMRKIVLRDGSETDADIYRREQIGQGQVIKGPVIIEQMDTTIFVGSEWVATQQENGNLVMRRKPFD